MALPLVNIGTGVETKDGDPLRTAFGKVNAYFIDHEARISFAETRLETLGDAADLDVGTVAGTIADGGALTVEAARAQAAEQALADAVTAETQRAQKIEALKAALVSPVFTGTPSAPTATAGTTGAQLATLDFVATAVAAGAGTGNQGVPPSRQIQTSGLVTGGGDLTADRIITVAKALQSDVAAGTDDTKALTSYSIAAQLGTLAPLASPAFAGIPTAPTAAAGTNTKQIASTAFVAGAVSAAVSGYAPLASPAFTGTPTAPTQAQADGSTKLATTAYADQAASNAGAAASSAAASAATPPSAVAYFARSTPPAGWLKANGAAVSRATYAALFAAIGTTFGGGDGSTTFNLPDLRGVFPRGLDDGRGIDGGRGLGSFQDSQNLAHTHTAQGTGQYVTVGGPTPANLASGPYLSYGPMDASGGNESRPKNVALLACIKF